ncbi:MAG: hypothetical protein C7B45_16590 [Sulfobacillus acidophilus]|uniref:Uncharacterized protein n=1 Tax=Sulfobacillus acidophilus TaxID=53633 RepID=A0A2T2WCX5_9FIRM|nr:MAG: hypothetical protein C7B45_16590 [Sulfobacillus acidophilus]
MNGKVLQSVLASSAIAVVAAGIFFAPIASSQSGTTAQAVAAESRPGAPANRIIDIEMGSNTKSYLGRQGAIHDPPSGGSLTAEQQGTLTVTYNAQEHGYEAVWVWSGLQPNQQVMLIGDKGTAVSTAIQPETVLFGTASSQGGTATIFIPANDYDATASTPETFEMLALFGSTPTGQLPDVPYAAALPVVAFGLGALWWWRRRSVEI